MALATVLIGILFVVGALVLWQHASRGGGEITFRTDENQDARRASGTEFFEDTLQRLSICLQGSNQPEIKPAGRLKESLWAPRNVHFG